MARHLRAASQVAAPVPQPVPWPAPNVQPSPSLLWGPPPPSAPFYQPEQFQAAKYFTFIFFGLSVFVILLFGGFVLCHCYRRLRYDHQRIRERNAQLAAMAAAGGGPSGPSRGVVVDVPVKEGYVVTNPDGALDIAYVPDTPASPQPGKSQPATSAAPDQAPPSSFPAPQQPPESSEPAAVLPQAGILRESLEVSRPETDVRWLRTVSSAPTSPVTGAARAAGGQRVQGTMDRLDQYWRQQQAQVYHIF